MILWFDGEHYYEMVAGAYLCDLNGKELRRVRDRSEVLAFLKAHPEQPFELRTNLRTPGRKLTDTLNLHTSVLCGIVHYNPATGRVISEPFEDT